MSSSTAIRKSGRELAAGRAAEIAANKAAVKQKQSDAIAALPIGGLYISVFLTSLEPTFHWSYYLHVGGRHGQKYHITGPPWISDHGTTEDTFKSMALTVFIKVGQIPTNVFGQLDQIMKMYDNQLSVMSGMTCRVWIFRVMNELIRAGIVQSTGSVDQLEAECWAFARHYSDDAASNVQPRPVVQSTICS